MPDICGCRFFFFSSRRRHTRCSRDWSSDVCSSDLARGDHDHRSRGQHEPLPARHPRTGACLSVVPGHSLLCGGSVWESNPSTVCLERTTGFEVREAHRVPRRFRYCKSALFNRSECTTVAREAPTVTVSPRNCHHARRQQPASRRLSGSRSRSKWRQSAKKRRGCRQRHPPRVYRVSRSALGLSVFRVYCFLADPKRTVPGSLRMRRISLLLATSTPSQCASPTNKLLTIVAECVQSGFTVTVPVNASDMIMPFALRVSWPEKFPSPSTVSTPVAAAGLARIVPLSANPHPPSRLASVHGVSSTTTNTPKASPK